ncbi:hypothetical protein NDU88_005398 [Pleurodeles waltl]|uniref:ABM domain-containing protein n=1 Tax=Pleurodeles waltl TaxID=8319 RepID=A0AAV7LMJ7_PLEWA|nr:hypothetical protein NDU88_005398 [Pleurodeles waltl]
MTSFRITHTGERRYLVFSHWAEMAEPAEMHRDPESAHSKLYNVLKPRPTLRWAPARPSTAADRCLQRCGREMKLESGRMSSGGTPEKLAISPLYLAPEHLMLVNPFTV